MSNLAEKKLYPVTTSFNHATFIRLSNNSPWREHSCFRMKVKVKRGDQFLILHL